MENMVGIRRWNLNPDWNMETAHWNSAGNELEPSNPTSNLKMEGRRFSELLEESRKVSISLAKLHLLYL